eukprot:scaffold63208_cov21-Tisochrysis_lutea.AAC.1
MERHGIGTDATVAEHIQKQLDRCAHSEAHAEAAGQLDRCAHATEQDMGEILKQLDRCMRVVEQDTGEILKHLQSTLRHPGGVPGVWVDRQAV